MNKDIQYLKINTSQTKSLIKRRFDICYFIGRWINASMQMLRLEFDIESKENLRSTLKYLVKLGLIREIKMRVGVNTVSTVISVYSLTREGLRYIKKDMEWPDLISRYSWLQHNLTCLEIIKKKHIYKYWTPREIAGLDQKAVTFKDSEGKRRYQEIKTVDFIYENDAGRRIGVEVEMHMKAKEKYWNNNSTRQKTVIRKLNDGKNIKYDEVEFYIAQYVRHRFDVMMFNQNFGKHLYVKSKTFTIEEVIGHEIKDFHVIKYGERQYKAEVQKVKEETPLFDK